MEQENFTTQYKFLFLRSMTKQVLCYCINIIYLCPITHTHTPTYTHTHTPTHTYTHLHTYTHTHTHLHTPTHTHLLQQAGPLLDGATIRQPPVHGQHVSPAHHSRSPQLATTHTQVPCTACSVAATTFVCLRTRRHHCQRSGTLR